MSYYQLPPVPLNDEDSFHLHETISQRSIDSLEWKKTVSNDIHQVDDQMKDKNPVNKQPKIRSDKPKPSLFDPNLPPPVPLMSIVIPLVEYPRSVSSASRRTSISETACQSPTPPVSVSCDNISSTSTLVDRIDISKFYFAHVIKVPHGTNLLASDNQSTTLCINTTGNIIHLITPTGYHIRSSRWPDTEKPIVDLAWCESLQVYLAATSSSLYTLAYDANQSLAVDKCLDFLHRGLSSTVFLACNSYRLYIHVQSSNSIDVYTLHFAHLHSKQLPDGLLNDHQSQIQALSCTSSFIVIVVENKLVFLDTNTMSIEYAFDLSYTRIASMRCLDDERSVVLIGQKQDGNYRLVFVTLGNESEAVEMQQNVVEKAIEQDEQFLCVLPNCRDLMVLSATAGRVQFVRYRS